MEHSGESGETCIEHGTDSNPLFPPGTTPSPSQPEYSAGVPSKDDEMQTISDLHERRRLMNRREQRSYRKKLKKRLVDLERRAAEDHQPPTTKADVEHTHPRDSGSPNQEESGSSRQSSVQSSSVICIGPPSPDQAPARSMSHENIEGLPQSFLGQELAPKTQFNTATEQSETLAGGNQSPMDYDATLHPPAAADEETSQDGGLIFITGATPADFKSRKIMTTVRKKAMDSFLRMDKKSGKKPMRTARFSSVEAEAHQPPTTNTDSENTTPRGSETPVQEENDNPRQSNILSNSGNSISPLTDIFGPFNKLSTAEARNVYLEAEQLFFDSEEDFNQVIRLFRYRAHKWSDDQRIELLRNVLEHVTEGIPLKEPATPMEQNTKVTEVLAPMSSSETTKQGAFVSQQRTSQEIGPEDFIPYSAWTLTPRSNCRFKSVLISEPSPGPSNYSNCFLGVLGDHCHIDNSCCHGAKRACGDFPSAFPQQLDSENFECPCPNYVNNGSSSSLCECGHQASLHNLQMGFESLQSPQFDWLQGGYNFTGAANIIGLNPAQTLIISDTSDQSADSGYFSNPPGSDTDFSAMASKPIQSLHIRTESGQDKGKDYAASVVATGNYIRKLQHYCSTQNIAQPQFQDYSDPRGIRTAWLSSVIIRGREYRAHLWRDYRYLEQSREEAAEVAWKALAVRIPSCSEEAAVPLQTALLDHPGHVFQGVVQSSKMQNVDSTASMVPHVRTVSPKTSPLKPSIHMVAKHAVTHSGASNEGARRMGTGSSVEDLAERRRLQNRIAQINYRKKMKERLENLNALAQNTRPDGDEAVVDTEANCVDPEVLLYQGRDESVVIQCICANTNDCRFIIPCIACGNWQHITCYYELAQDVVENHECVQCSPRGLGDRGKRQRKRSAQEAGMLDAGSSATPSAKRPRTAGAESSVGRSEVNPRPRLREYHTGLTGGLVPRIAGASSLPSSVSSNQASQNVFKEVQQNSNRKDEEPQALLLASKSNYLNIPDGNTVPDVSHPTDLSTSLTSKRTSHKIAEEGRRNRINSALQEMQALLVSTKKYHAERIVTTAAEVRNSKATTVESAVRYIKKLQQKLSEKDKLLEARTAEMEQLKRERKGDIRKYIKKEATMQTFTPDSQGILTPGPSSTDLKGLLASKKGSADVSAVCIGYQVVERYSKCRCLYYRHAPDTIPGYENKHGYIQEKTVLVGYACSTHDKGGHLQATTTDTEEESKKDHILTGTKLKEKGNEVEKGTSESDETETEGIKVKIEDDAGSNSPFTAYDNAEIPSAGPLAHHDQPIDEPLEANMFEGFGSVLEKVPNAVQDLLPEYWRWDVEYQMGCWTCTPLEPDTPKRYPLTIGRAPVVLPVEYQWPPMGGVNPPPDPRPSSPVDCRAELPVEVVRDLFLTFEGSVGFYILISGLLQIIVPEDFDTTWASSHLPHKYGGLKVCYIPQTVEATMLPSTTETTKAQPVLQQQNSGLSSIFRQSRASTGSSNSVLKLNDFIEARPKANHRKEKYSGRIGLKVNKGGFKYLVMSTHIITEAILAKSHREQLFGRGRGRFDKLDDDWNEHIDIWAGNEKIGTIDQSFDKEAEIYPNGFHHDVTLVKPSTATSVKDIASPIPGLGWLNRESWSSLRQHTAAVKILGPTEDHRSAKSIKCSRPSEILVVGEGIFLNQTAATANSKSLKDHDMSTWKNLVSRALLYRMYPDFDPPNGYSGTALYADGAREDGSVGPGIVGFQSFVQRSGHVQNYAMEGPALERRLQLGRVAFYGAFEVPEELKRDYTIV